MYVIEITEFLCQFLYNEFSPDLLLLIGSYYVTSMLLEKWIYRQDLIKCSWPLTQLPITRYWNLGVYLTAEEGSTWHGPVQMLDLKIKLTREQSSQHWGRLLPPKTFLYELPSSVDHLFPDSYTMKNFMTFLFAFSLKDNAIVHISQAIATGGNPTFNQLLNLPWCWLVCSSAHKKTSPLFSMPWFLQNTLSAPSMSYQTLTLELQSFPASGEQLQTGETLQQALYKESNTRQK